MAKSIILEIMNGETSYIDKVRINNNADYRKYSSDYEKTLNILCNGLPDDEKRRLLRDLDTAQGGMFVEYADEFFKAGFKLGLSLAAQNFLDD